jgi:hypothetical protein
MAFNNVIIALRDLLQADTNLLTYVHSTQFLIGFRENFPLQDYTIILEPDPEEEHDDRQTGDGRKEVGYTVNIHGRLGLVSPDWDAHIVGDSANSVKGILEMMDDIKAAIRADLTLGYSLLTGAEVATNIQSSLRALGVHTEDGYYFASCTFDDTTNQFTIATDGFHPDWSVAVLAGASDDCSSLLGFDSPTEVAGRNIVEIEFRSSYPVNSYFPIRYRILPVVIREEITII